MLCISNPALAVQLLKADQTIEISPMILERVIGFSENELIFEVIDHVKDLNVVYTMSPLETAIRAGKIEVVQHLIEAGADINYEIKSEDGMHYTAMHVAAENTSNDILKYLLEKGGDLEVEDSEGMLPYDRAKAAGLEENVKIL